jgi:hypothetical protein
MAKDLWYDSRLLGETAPSILGPLARSLHALSELLGDDHDLAVLVKMQRSDALDELSLDKLVRRARQLQAPGSSSPGRHELAAAIRRAGSDP